MLKRRPKTRFWLVFLMIGIVQLFSYTVIIPVLALLFRWLGKFNPFWFWLDDTRKNKDGSLASDYAIHLDHYKPFWRWWGVLTWHANRNKAWNFVELFSRQPWTYPGNQFIAVIKQYGRLYHLGPGANGNVWEVDLKADGPWVISAGLKYVGKPGQDPWQVNRGTIISGWYSIFGNHEMTFHEPWRDGGAVLYWRKTSCRWIPPKKVFGITLPFTGKYRTLFLGQNGSRYAFKWKHQDDDPVQEEDWKL